MDGIANVAKQQQTQVNTHVDSGASQGRVAQPQAKVETSKIIRRFPAEKAADFLPKMQEVTGMLFDMKG